MKLSCRRLDLHLSHTWTIARSGPADEASTVLVQLTDLNGLTGMGEAAPISRYGESVESVISFCQRLDADQLSFTDFARSMNYLDSLSPKDFAAKCAVNLALLDGVATQARKSVHDFLGLGFRENQHVTSFTIGIDRPEMIRKKVQHAERFPILKFKVGGLDDKANLRALREVAPAKWLRLDANEGWKTKEQALEMIEWFAQDKFIQFVEQPMPATTSIKDWSWLKSRSPLPIFADESYHTAEDAERCAECFHGINVKLVKTGGITAGINALQAARKVGLKTMLGCMIETSVLISAAAHLAELCDYLDIDGNLLITNDPFIGVQQHNGVLSFADSRKQFGLCVEPR